ncbi:MAG: hypothetical protein U9O06_00705 [Euryarchaeota archaeon]|nr:hypothetical protein [Euryarchaeota archaeon]
MSTPPHHPTTDCAELLSDPTRRRVCSILSSPDPPVSERDLAVELATRFLDRPAADITPEQRRQQQISLHHHQLPKLADHGLIVYDQTTRTVSLTAEGYEALAASTDTHHQPPATAFIRTD